MSSAARERVRLRRNGWYCFPYDFLPEQVEKNDPAPERGEESPRSGAGITSTALVWISEDRLAASNFHGAKVILRHALAPSLEIRIRHQGCGAVIARRSLTHTRAGPRTAASRRCTNVFPRSRRPSWPTPSTSRERLT